MASSIDSIVTNAINGRDSEVRRASAVASALELILSKVTSPASAHGQLEHELNNLETYADQIEEALKVK